MAENPQEWCKATALISDVMEEEHRQMLEDAASGNYRCGFSTPMRITLALKEAGYLTDEALTSRAP